MNLSHKILAQHQNPPAYAPHRGLLFGQFLSVGALVLGFAGFASAQSVKRTPDDANPQKHEFNANRPPDWVLQLRA